MSVALVQQYFEYYCNRFHSQFLMQHIFGNSKIDIYQLLEHEFSVPVLGELFFTMTSIIQAKANGWACVLFKYLTVAAFIDLLEKVKSFLTFPDLCASPICTLYIPYLERVYKLKQQDLTAIVLAITILFSLGLRWNFLR